MPGKAPCPLRRRGSDKYFIWPANPRASHSSMCSNSGNSPADTTPHRSNPSSLARDSTHTVSDLVRIFLILPHHRQVCDRNTLDGKIVKNDGSNSYWKLRIALFSSEYTSKT